MNDNNKPDRFDVWGTKLSDKPTVTKHTWYVFDSRGNFKNMYTETTEHKQEPEQLSFPGSEKW